MKMSTELLKSVWAYLPLLPVVCRVSLAHVLRLSDSAEHLDLKNSILVAAVRAILLQSKPKSVAKLQEFSTRDTPVKGKIWISKYTTPRPPELEIRDAMVDALEELAGDGSTEPSEHKFRARLDVPSMEDVQAEWTGHRAGAADDEGLPDTCERRRYHDMMLECTSPTTLLYFHGGAYYLCDPATHRPTARRLAGLTGGRCFSVRYRLAPQHPFPAALLDALVSYFSLLYPPPDAYHCAVLPEHIVLAGDR